MTKYGEAQDWVRRAVSYNEDDCLEWPFSRTKKGYGQFRVGKVRCNAHRAVAIAAHGPPPPGKTEVAHSCGNRACCNPTHLRHATSSENKADMVGHGTSNRGEKCPMAKLTEVQARAAKYGDGSISEYADKLGVSRHAILLIRKGKSWAHL